MIIVSPIKRFLILIKIYQLMKYCRQKLNIGNKHGHDAKEKASCPCLTFMYYVFKYSILYYFKL